MKKLLAGFFLVILLLSFVSCKKTPKNAVVGSEAPDIVLGTSGGGTWRLSNERGSVVVINFWATWCPSCREEMPSLQRLYEMKKSDASFKIVTVLFKDTPENAEAYMKENGFTLPVMIDPLKKAALVYGLTGVPETYIVDKKGILREKIIGPVEFDSPEAIKFFDTLLKE